MTTEIKNGVTHYIYPQDEWTDFLKRGYRDGNVGMLPVKKDGNITTYKGFGTIENPCRRLMTLSIVDNPLFDNPKLELTSPDYVSFHILDFSK